MNFKCVWRRSVASFTLISFVFSYAPLASASGGVNADVSDLQIAGQAYKLIVQRNALGRVTRQILLGTKRTEISIDSKGTGKLDSWELITPGADVTLHDPYKGKFSFMDVVQETKTAKVTMKFSYNPSIRKYELYSMQAKKYRKLFAQDFVVGCRINDTQMPALTDLAKQLNALLNRNSQDSDLKAQLEKSVMNDKSCDEGLFKSNKDHLLNAVMEVAASDKTDWSGARPKTRGRFLQCLRYYDLGVHASRIAAGIGQYLVKGAGQGNPWSLSCSTMGSANLAQTPEARMAALNNEELGSFDQASHQISINIAQAKTDEKGLHSGAAVREEFAHVFFHEMVHYSNIEDEQVTHSLEDCCSQPDNGKDNGSCKNLEGLLKDKVYAQQLENSIARKFPTYAGFRDMLREHFGPLADPMLDDFYTQAGRVFQEYSKKCVPRSLTYDYGKCKQDFYDKLGQTVYGQFFDGGRCMTQSMIRVSREKAQEFCDNLKESAGALFHVQFSATGRASVCRERDQASVSSVRAQYALFQMLYSSVAMAAEPKKDACDPNRAISFEEMMEGFRGTALSDLPADDGGDHSNVSPPVEVIAKDVQPNLQDRKNDGSLTNGTTPTTGIDITAKDVRPDVPAAKKDIAKDPGDKTTSVTDAPPEGNKFPSSSAGPERPIYSNDSPDRQRALSDHIEQSDSVLIQTKRLADNAADAILPQARASDDSGSTSRSKSSLINPADLPKYTSHLPSLTVPDPLDSSANQAIKGDRSASLKGLGGDRSSASIDSDSHVPQYSGPSVGGGRGGQSASAAGQSSPRVPAGSARGDGGGGGTDGSGPVSSGSGSRGAASANGGNKSGWQETPYERAARKKFFEYLQGPYVEVGPDLVRPQTLRRIFDYKLQIIDANGRKLGFDSPKHKFVYDGKLKRLKLQDRR